MRYRSYGWQLWIIIWVSLKTSKIPLFIIIFLTKMDGQFGGRNKVVPTGPTDHSHPAVDTQDLWIFTAASRQPGVSLPVDLPMGMGPDGGDTAVAEKAMVKSAGCHGFQRVKSLSKQCNEWIWMVGWQDAGFGWWEDWRYWWLSACWCWIRLHSICLVQVCYNKLK